MAAVSTHLHESSIKIQETSDDEPYSPNTRDTTTPEYPEDEKAEERAIHTSSFSIHNVLKKERDSNSPDNVFSTDKLLQSTPIFEDSRSFVDSRNSDRNFEDPRNLERSFDDSRISDRNFEDSRSSERNFDDSRNSERNFDDSRLSESVSPHDDISRTEISVDDENSCSSDDTVLSVGNEAPVSFDSDKSQDNPGLTSFKHIQTHLNAISQLSQNVMNQPLLLRPSPITPNPLMFLNQPLLFQNPLINQVDLKTVPRMPVPQNLPNQFGLNFGFRKTQEFRRSDENRRHYMPKSPEDKSRDYQSCLKFSIDNILKADFGRRITDPIKRKKRYEVKATPVKDVPAKVEESRVPEIKAGEKGAIDLSKSEDSGSNQSGSTNGDGMVWPAWVYCTRYSDRPSSDCCLERLSVRNKLYCLYELHQEWLVQEIRLANKYETRSRHTRPRTRRPKKPPGETNPNDEKRPRTAFSGPQLARLKHEFAENRYLTERRRQALAAELGLAEAQIKIWFQNKRAKIKKASGQRNPLALQLMAQGLYNHSTVPLTKEEEELEMKAREREAQNRV